MDKLLISVLNEYGIMTLIVMFIIYGVYKFLLTAAPQLTEKVLSKIKLFPRREKIVSDIAAIAVQLKTVTDNVLLISEENKICRDDNSKVIRKLEEMINSFNILDSSVQLWKDTIKEMTNFKVKSQQDQIRKIDLRLRLATYEGLVSVLVHMVSNPDETNSLQGIALENEIEKLCKQALAKMERHFKTLVYPDLITYNVPQSYIDCMDKVLFEYKYLDDSISLGKKILKMRGSAIEQFEAIKSGVETFHFNVIDKMERILNIHVPGGDGDGG